MLAIGNTVGAVALSATGYWVIVNSPPPDQTQLFGNLGLAIGWIVACLIAAVAGNLVLVRVVSTDIRLRQHRRSLLITLCIALSMLLFLGIVGLLNVI